jgi:hypothetical protein
MKYFVMGDSNLIGANTDPSHINYGPDPDNFMNIIGRNLDIEFECWAKNGASNDHIIRMTEEWIANTPGNPKEKFVLIGWSTWEREEHKISEKYYDIDAWSIYNAFWNPPELNPFAESLKQRVESDPYYMDSCSRAWAERIHNYAKFLENRGIKYFFWNAYMTLLRPPTSENFQFDHRYVLPYEDCFNQYFWLKRVRNHPPKADDPYHFDQEGHRMWAEFLTQYIQDWKILEQ